MWISTNRLGTNDHPAAGPGDPTDAAPAGPAPAGPAPATLAPGTNRPGTNGLRTDGHGSSAPARRTAGRLIAALGLTAVAPAGLIPPVLAPGTNRRSGSRRTDGRRGFAPLRRTTGRPTAALGLTPTAPAGPAPTALAPNTDGFRTNRPGTNGRRTNRLRTGGPGTKGDPAGGWRGFVGVRRAARRLGAVLGVAVVALAGPAPAALAGPGPASAGLTPAAIDRFVNGYLAETGLPGAVVAVTRGEKVVHTGGYGRTAGGTAMTGRTPVPVASLSKSMTALAVMQLVEEGKVDLDRPVRGYLPEFTMADERAARITVRQLLDQTSGMADSAFPDLALPQAHTLKGAVARMRGARLAAEPGTRWNYHNPNYFVAARLVEVVTGEPFADRLRDHVFAPLRMTDSRSVDSTTDMPEDARGYVRAYGRVVERAHPRWFTAGGHGVVTTADDLARWLIAQNNGGVGADGRRVVSARSLDIMHTPPEGENYAMGWSLGEARGGKESPPLQHTGSLLTQNAIQILLPDRKTGIAVVSNTGMVSGDDSVGISDGLRDLAEGRAAEIREPFSVTADYVLAALTLLALGLGTLGTVRAPRWARRAAGRPLWRAGLRTLPYALPVACLVWLADLVGLLMRREGTFGQVVYVWPALVVCVAAAALASAAVIASRGGHLTRAVLRGRRPAGDGQAESGDGTDTARGGPAPVVVDRGVGAGQ
ncbi:serine hydrolase domain-containing protein [Streptomyces sp. NBC_00838]|uniref:serine hydrolase domain-containing protein n=1 Tax=Streptomyces sp. NBC_00838 TaxID=2903680 RepID=UPI003866327B|nr:serine hydrolase domain-containing protein [Streptomyces sp. NBC_00838]